MIHKREDNSNIHNSQQINQQQPLGGDRRSAVVGYTAECFVCAMFIRYVYVMASTHVHAGSSQHQTYYEHHQRGQLVFSASMIPMEKLIVSMFSDDVGEEEKKNIKSHDTTSLSSNTLSLEYLELVLAMMERLGKSCRGGVNVDAADVSAHGSGSFTTIGSKRKVNTSHGHIVNHDTGYLVMAICMSITEQILRAGGGHNNSIYNSNCNDIINNNNNFITASQYEHFPLRMLQLSNSILQRIDNHKPTNHYHHFDNHELPQNQHHNEHDNNHRHLHAIIRQSGLSIINSICNGHWSTYLSLAHIDPLIFSKYW